MDDRYSPSDRQIYGAEDDFEMDMILDAMDRALAGPERTSAAAERIAAAPTAVAHLCTKTPYRTQAAARQALAQWKSARPDDPKVPRRVYPCDVCDGWHLTRKQSGRRVPPWDKNPQWQRPAGQLAKLQPRFAL
ncbi:hypothetical protein R8Z57_07760 [Microbacterium sp. M3]|uniref:Uncharacterized protein n=1 Tax=Microbacterium arthrosphaerae TaxID=792652 RepID=A0ABU4H018_9MICO|nr:MULTISPECIES: hypothetical protein [Microbacterium]MDW4572671.1 hypothetical protein [Microbacterium arthrosphaerae]MDW7606526.1 hypothetical protein [Microbacterium sp. M3]